MWMDARQIPAGSALDADVCIVGGGAAGITLALELAASGLQVILAEAGGESYDDASQALYAGTAVGAAFDPMLMRLRQLGGSTGHWGGRSRPLEEADFAARPWVPHSGWPIPYAELAAHLPRALELCEIAGDVFSADPALPFDPSRVEGGFWRFSPPTAFGDRYGPALRAASHLRLLLHAALVDIGLDEGCARVERLVLATAVDRRLDVRCRYAVLACGGLENARLLLAARRQMACGIGNARDLVGRYFMGHPIWDALEIQLHPGVALPAVYGETEDGGDRIEGMLRLGREAQRRFGTTSVDAAFYQGGQFGPPGVRAARRIWRGMRRGHLPDALGRDISIVLGDLDGVLRAGLKRSGLAVSEPSMATVSLLVEQAPDPDSRVTLGEGEDALGLPPLVVDWRISELDRHSVATFSRILAEEAGRIGLGRARLEPWVADTDLPMPPHSNSAHHLGTTRMSADPATGVVDTDGRVHGIDNLYIAGSSIFPTGGSVHPTLNLVALTVRLAAHLHRRSEAGEYPPFAQAPL